MKNDAKKEGQESLVPNVLERLIEFKDYTGMSVNSFVDGIGMEYVTVLNQLNKKRGLSLDTVLNTLNAYPELSADWLLRDRGDMFVSKYADTPEGITRKYSERLESLVDTIQILNDTIKQKDATIDALKAELAQYKSQIKEAQ